MSCRQSKAVFALCGLLLAGAGAARADDAPAYAAGPLHSPGTARVETVGSSLASDYVVLAGGLESGLRTGMVCRVVRGPDEVAEIVIIEARTAAAAALILQLSDNQSIRAGDLARVKTIKKS